MSIQCGLCEKTIPDNIRDTVYFPTSHGIEAHSKCWNKVKELAEKINRVLRDNQIESYHTAHTKIIGDLREKCGKPIINYVDKKGLNDLIAWFDNMGLETLNMCIYM